MDKHWEELTPPTLPCCHREEESVSEASDHPVCRIDKISKPKIQSLILPRIFQFRRPENAPRHFILIAALAAFVLLAWSGRVGKLQPSGLLFPAGITGYFLYQQWKWRRMPPCSLQVDDEGLQLLPVEHWKIGPVPWSAVREIREDPASVWVIYMRGSSGNALELEKHFFTRGEAKELLEQLRTTNIAAKKAADAVAGIR
jgi:hypothetical protein